MIRFIPACLLLAGFWLSMTAAGAAPQVPGSSNLVEQPHMHARHHSAKGHGKSHVHSGKTAFSALKHRSREPVRRNEGMNDAPIQSPDTKTSRAYNPASEFTITPHMMLNIGAGGRL